MMSRSLLSFSRRLLSTDSLHSKISRVVGESEVSSGESVRASHGQDLGYNVGKSPDLVAFPKNVGEVSEICKLCNDVGFPVIAFGTGTGLEGGISALHGGVCLNLSKMDKIVEYSASDFYAVVEPGVTRQSLDHEIKDDGLWFPVDPGAEASICGMCATAASGTNAVRFGTIKENCLNLEVVLADGTILETGGIGRKCKKSSAGYNLTELFVGSEGTLGVITKATVRLHALPEAEAAAVVCFPDVDSAVRSVVETLQCSVPVARMELMDADCVEACNNYSKTQFSAKPTLFLEFKGSSSEIGNQAETVRSISQSLGGLDFSWAENQEDRNRLWKARHDMHWALKAVRPKARYISTDVCVPVSRLPEMIKGVNEDLKKHGLFAPILGHVGDGNFHCHLYFDPLNPESFSVCMGVAERMALRALQVGGTCTGEHGVGMGKVELLETQFGPAGIRTLKMIKESLDPKGIMNPGKVLRLGPS